MDVLRGLLGLVPFVVLFAGLAVFRWRSYLVAALALALSAIMALVLWNSNAMVLLTAGAEGVVLALVPIIWVIFGAVFTYFLSTRTGAMDHIKDYLRKLSPEHDLQAVIIAFLFGGFLESVAGFGTAVAIPTAMLISMGHKPVSAATVSLVANSVPVAFGALGIPVIVLAEITSLDVRLLTRYVVFQLLPFSLLLPLLIAAISRGGVKGLSRVVGETLLIGAVFALTQTLVGVFMGPELVAVAASLVTLLAYIIYRRVRAGTLLPGFGLLKAVSNYAILLVLVILTRVVFVDAFSAPAFVFEFTIGSTEISIDWLTTPGTLLLLSAIMGGLLQGAGGEELGASALQALSRIKFSALTIVLIVALAKLLGESGMIASVSAMLAAATGPFFPMIAPALGALGTFVTGSDTSSNILFGELQQQTAMQAGYNAPWIVASNTSGATAGKMISPQSISVAASTVGIEHEEGNIMKSTVLVCAAYAILVGVLTYIGALFIVP